MSSTFRVHRLTALFLTIIVFSLMILPASSRSVIMSEPPADHGTHAPSPSNIDTLGLFLALSIIWLWIMNRMTAIRFANSDIRLLTGPITVAEQLAQQLSYLRFTTLLGVATANILDADNTDLDPARPQPEGDMV